jgi:hypothetical protein
LSGEIRSEDLRQIQLGHEEGSLRDVVCRAVLPTLLSRGVAYPVDEGDHRPDQLLA